MNKTDSGAALATAEREGSTGGAGRGGDLRVVLIGAGKMARHHAGAITRVPGARVVGYSDPSESARAAMAAIVPSAVGFDEIEQLVRECEADIAHVCTPPKYHFAAARTALEAGLHVYVEKPFVPTTAEARELLDLARARGLSVCAGHQLLAEPPTVEALRLLPAVRDLVHVESYFSFRTVRRTADGSAPMPAHEQLLDILPHPVYLLVRMLEAAEPEHEAKLAGLELGPAGTIHALVRAGTRTASLTVTLEGRPVESYLRIVGSYGSIVADYVRGTVQRSIGPGTSGIDKILNPYRLSGQLAAGTTAALWRRAVNRRRSYPGLTELFTAFYDSVRHHRPSPVSPRNILATTRICEDVALALQLQSGPSVANASSTRRAGRVVVTGGSGFLGKCIVRSLCDAGLDVTVLSRRLPPPWERADGIEYVTADLGRDVDAAMFEGADAIVHCAAATSGGWDVHQRDSIDATRALFRAAAAAGITKVIHVSSLAVQEAVGRNAISEATPLAADSKARGPYAWGKLESERLAVELGAELGIAVRIVRPGALVDYERFDPPGRLGRRIGNMFVAVGSGRDRLGVCDVSFAGDVLAWMIRNWDESPATLNLLDPVLPTKRDLVKRLRTTDPDITVFWLPRALLYPLSWGAMALQKVLRPGKPAINVARVFAAESYDTSVVNTIAARAGHPVPR